MAAACATCGAKKAAGVHLTTSSEYHPYADATRSGLQPVSEGKRAYLASETHKAIYAEASSGYCVGHAVGAPGRCSGPLTPHHTASRGASGGQEAAEKRAPVVMLCSTLNDAIGSDPEVKRWAETHTFTRDGVQYPFLVHPTQDGTRARNVANLSYEEPMRKDRQPRPSRFQD